MLGRDILNCCFITAVGTSTVLSCAGHKELHLLYSFIGQLCHNLGLDPPDQVDPYISMISSRNFLGTHQHLQWNATVQDITVLYLHALRDIDTTMFRPIHSLVVGLSPVEWWDALQQAPNIPSKRLRSNLTAVTTQCSGLRSQVGARESVGAITPRTGRILKRFSLQYCRKAFVKLGYTK